MVLINFLPRSIRLERISLLKNYIRNFLFRSRKKTCNSKKKKNNQLTRILEQIHEFQKKRKIRRKNINLAEIRQGKTTLVSGNS